MIPGVNIDGAGIVEMATSLNSLLDKSKANIFEQLTFGPNIQIKLDKMRGAR
jgi:hypothetical protein